MGGGDAAEKSEALAAAAEAAPAAAAEAAPAAAAEAEAGAETAAAALAADAAPSGSDAMEVEPDTKTKEEAVAAGAGVPAGREASAAAITAEDASSKEQEGREEGGKAVGDEEQGKKDEVESKGAEAAANGSATATGKRPREEDDDVAQDGDKGAAPAAATASASAATAADGAGKKARLILKDDVRAEVLRQMEYYFSDSNLPRDKFMKEKIQEGDGWVSLPLLCTFARMRKHLGVEADTAVPTHLVEAVADLLRASSQLLRVSDDGQQVKREGALPLGREHIAEINARSLFATPFEWCSSLEDVHSFFSKLGQVRSVTLRRHANSKVFRGSVFVEMGSEEEMRKVTAMKGLTHNGVEIRMEPKLEFVERVKRERVEGRSQDDGEDVEGGKKEVEAGGREGDKDEDADGGDRERDDDFPKGVIVSITLVRKSKPVATEEKEKAEDEGTKAAGEVEKERDANDPEKVAEGEKMDTEEEGNDESQKKTQDDASGRKEESEEKAEEGKGEEDGNAEKKDAENPEEADKSDGKGEPVEEKKKEKEQKEREDVAEGVTREVVRSAFEMYGNVKFVEYSQGRLTGFVRYDDAHSAQTALQKTGENGSAPLTLKGFSVIARVLNDEEEQEYWGKLREAMKNRHTGGRGGRGGRGRGWGGRGGGGGGWRGDRQDRRSGGRGGRGGGGWGGRGRGGRGGGGGRSGHTRFDDDE